jgi:DNA-binding beta-propeller fold protein YncE
MRWQGRRTGNAWRLLIAVGLSGALAAGCGGGSAEKRAAEPATAPPPGQAPAGRVVRLAPAAEGVVADPESRTVAVAVNNPSALVLLDGRTGRVRHRVALPGSARHLQLQKPGGPVLVPVEGADRLLWVEVESGRVSGSIPTAKHPHDATATDDGSVFVTGELGSAVQVVRGQSVVHTFRGIAQPGGTAAAGDLVGVIDVRDLTLTVYDAARQAQVGRVPAGRGPTHVVADRRGRLLVIDTRGESVLSFALSPAVRLDSRFPLPGHPYGVAYDARRDRLWVTLTGRNQLVGLDLRGGTPKVAARLPTVRQANTVAVDETTGRVFVTGGDGTLQIVDP